MGRNIILTESQFKGYISFLKQQSLLKEDASFERGYRTYQIKSWLDKNFIPDHRAKHGEFDMLTDSEYCAIVKNTINEKEPVVVSPKEMYEMLISKFSKGFPTPQDRNKYMEEIINAWFGYKSEIKVYGGQNPEAIIIKK